MNREVIVVGAGALGSHFTQFARNLDASLRAIDDDRVESRNTMAQFHSKTSVGKSKAQSLAQLMDFLFKVKVTAIPHRLTVDNARQLLSGAALIVDCLDNAVSRLVVQETARALSLPCLHGALAADGGFGRVVWDEHFKIDSEASAGAPTCEGGEHLPFVALVASYLARAAQVFLSSGRRVGYEVSPAGAIAT